MFTGIHDIPGSCPFLQISNGRPWLRFREQDATVIATAAPSITRDFDSLRDIGWYSSAYFLTMCIPQLAYVKIYGRYPLRLVYSSALLVFLAGSALCGAAPNSSAFIAGRALAGLGAAGLFSGNNALVPYLSPSPKRPLLFGFFLAAMSLGQGSGPLIGGILTEKMTWRWNVCCCGHMLDGVWKRLMCCTVLHQSAHWVLGLCRFLGVGASAELGEE